MSSEKRQSDHDHNNLSISYYAKYLCTNIVTAVIVRNILTKQNIIVRRRYCALPLQCADDNNNNDNIMYRAQIENRAMTPPAPAENKYPNIKITSRHTTYCCEIKR